MASYIYSKVRKEEFFHIDLEEIIRVKQDLGVINDIKLEIFEFL